MNEIDWSMSPDIKELVKGLAEFQSEVQTLKKSADNPFFKSKYLPLPELLRGIQPYLSNNGLAIVQMGAHQITGGKGTEVPIVTLLAHTTGQWIRGVLHMPVEKHDPQKMGSSITYGCRYSICMMLGIAGAEDDDAEHAMKTHRERDEEPPPLLTAAIMVLQDVKTKSELRKSYLATVKGKDIQGLPHKWQKYLETTVKGWAEDLPEE